MIKNSQCERQDQQSRLKAKTLDSMFRRRVETGANCPPFVSEAILRQAKDVYDLHGENTMRNHGIGQVKFLAVRDDEPPGKPINECQKVAVFLTLEAGDDDQQIRHQRGTSALRQARILRMTTEAKQQGALLSYEDLAYRLLNCGLRTIVRDANAIRKRGVSLPTRGQQKDMGPRQNHRVKAVELFLQGLEYKEIARRIVHALSSVENYVTTFARVVLLTEKGYCDDEIARIIQRSPSLVASYRQLAEEKADTQMARRRIGQILRELSPEDRNHYKKGGIQ